MIDDRHRHPSSRATPVDELIDREIEAAIEDGHTLEPDVEADDEEDER